MAKNILLLFLSPIKTIKVGDRVIIPEASYENIDDEKTKTTNESAVRYLLQKNIIFDKIFIFASEKVRGKISHYDRTLKQNFDFVDDNNQPQTHLQFFTERVRKFLPNVDFEIYNYDEKISGDENLKSVAEMAQLIQNFLTDEEIILHVDLTGGMRHVNMMMLELTRLLEYSGLTVGKVLYSNYDVEKSVGNVEEIQNTYSVFQLIAGVEEFVNFGSVKALKLYYANKKVSCSLEKLLTAMENFAEAIKLCHYWKFRTAIENLHDAVRDFKPAPDDLQDILMDRFIKRIRKNYAKLIDLRDLDDLRVIRWCLENDYLQQALTLYTERIPEYLGEKKFLDQSESNAKILTDEVNNDNMGRNRFFYLFSEINPKEDRLGKILTKILTKYQRHLKSYAWPAIRKKNFDFEEWATKLDAAINEPNFSVKDEPRICLQLETLAKIFQDPKLLVNLNSPELEPLGKLFAELSPRLEQLKYGVERQKIIANFMTVAKVELLSKVFDGLSVEVLYKVFDGAKYPHAKKMYNLLVEGFFYVNIPEEKFLSIVEKYFVIKGERNHTNHAHEYAGEFETSDDLRDFMLNALDEIEENLPAL